MTSLETSTGRKKAGNRRIRARIAGMKFLCGGKIENELMRNEIARNEIEKRYGNVINDIIKEMKKTSDSEISGPEISRYEIRRIINKRGRIKGKQPNHEEIKQEIFGYLAIKKILRGNSDSVRIMEKLEKSDKTRSELYNAIKEAYNEVRKIYKECYDNLDNHYYNVVSSEPESWRIKRMLVIICAIDRNELTNREKRKEVSDQMLQCDIAGAYNGATWSCFHEREVLEKFLGCPMCGGE